MWKSWIKIIQFLPSCRSHVSALLPPPLPPFLRVGEQHLVQLKHGPCTLCWDMGKIRYDLNILFLVVYQSLGQRRHLWNAPCSAERFHFPSPATAKGNNVAAGLVIRSHLSLLQPHEFNRILDQWVFCVDPTVLTCSELPRSLLHVCRDLNWQCWAQLQVHLLLLSVCHLASK